MSKARELLELMDEKDVATVWRDSSYSNFLVLVGDDKSANGLMIDKNGKIKNQYATEDDAQGMILLKDLNDPKINPRVKKEIITQGRFLLGM